MKQQNDHYLFLNNGGNSQFGFYRAVALFPMNHKKGNKIWLPYDYIIDMSRVLILAERRNFQDTYTKFIHEKFGLVINREAFDHLRTVDTWRPYHGQQIIKSYQWDQTFPMMIDGTNFRRASREVHLPSITNTPLYEWYFDPATLIRFFSDPRFQGMLLNSGFQEKVNQLDLGISA